MRVRLVFFGETVCADRCDRRDCRELFLPKSTPGPARRYCSARCAHLAADRGYRSRRPRTLLTSDDLRERADRQPRDRDGRFIPAA